MNKKLKIAVLLSTLALTSIYFVFFSAKTYEGYEVKRQALVQKVIVTGSVIPNSRAQIGSKIVGAISTVDVEEGWHVNKGQVLAKLNQLDGLATLVQAEAAYAQATAKLTQHRMVAAPVAQQNVRECAAQLHRAIDDYQREKELLANGASTVEAAEKSRQALETVTSQCRAAKVRLQAAAPNGADTRVLEAELIQAEANVKDAKTHLADTLILAPENGLILNRKVEPGDVVEPGKVLFVMSLDGPTVIDIQVDEKYLALLKLQQRAYFTADAFPNDPLPARIEFIAPNVDPARGTIEVKLHATERPEFIKEDMSVSVNVEVARKDDCLTLPIDGLHEMNNGTAWVMVYEGGRVKRRNVTTGIKGDNLVEIRLGLNEGDRVLSASAKVAQGKRVHLKVVN